MVAAAIAVVALAGCTPDPAPAHRWVSTRFAYQRDDVTTVSWFGAWTDAQWFASVRVESPTTPGPSDVRLQVFPREGTGGSRLGTPQDVPLSGVVGFPSLIGEHVIAVVGTPTTFVRQTAGRWAAAGTFDLELGYQPMAMDDHWLVVRKALGEPGALGDGEVRVYALDTTGPTVTATLAATLGPDPVWPAELRAGFGRAVALDGDLLAVGANRTDQPGPGAVRAFRADARTWGPVASFGAGVDDPSWFGDAVAVDDGASVDRLAISTQAGTGRAVEVLADSGGGFAPEDLLTPGPTDPTAHGPDIFGSALAIDGDRLAATSHRASVPSADPSHPRVDVAHVSVFRHGTTWAPETEVATYVDPTQAGVISTYPIELHLVGTHVAVSQIVTPDPPPGCPFPCFAIGFEAWSIDRR
jgi:hypothetical protein